MRSVIAVLLLLTTGCATMVAKRGEGGKYAPTNEARGGTVKYNAQGFGAEGRRKGAYKAMYKRCDGPYKILGEQTGKGPTTAVPAFGTVIYQHQQEISIDFECEPKP